MNNLKVFSGECCQCDVGIPVGHEDMHGNPLHTGDIVQLWSGDYIGTDLEQWTPTDHLTCVVSDQYQSYTSGRIEEKDNPRPFVMGIKDAGFGSPEWKVRIVKSHADVIQGEHWTAFGFRFDTADISQAGGR